MMMAIFIAHGSINLNAMVPLTWKLWFHWLECYGSIDLNAMVPLTWMLWFHWLECYGSIDLNAQRAEGDYRPIENGQKRPWEDLENFGARWVHETLNKKGQSENRWVFRRLRNIAEESASLIVCGRAFQGLGAELEKALKPSYFVECFSVALGIGRRGWDEERRDRGMSSCLYSGAVPS